MTREIKSGKDDYLPDDRRTSTLIYQIGAAPDPQLKNRSISNGIDRIQI